ncbi:unnamed protein product [Toxocara canis]|uniref:Kinesin motor domain-containing protein n=1 Tax=Toxocara canis TaxID=6265 RepID=A0A183VA89_TOXCA|nr:unnamed protein product [Toxocara canis]
MRSGTADESMDSAIRSERDDPLLLDAAANGRTATVYRPTTTRSEASATSTKKSYGKLTEVYSNSGDTVEFAHNFANYVNTIVSPCKYMGGVADNSWDMGNCFDTLW